MIDRIRQAVRAQRYRLSLHAIEEMAEDELESDDIEEVVLTGQVASRFTLDPRGVRYEVVGDTLDGRRACIVCRFLTGGQLLVITAYAIEG